MSNINLNEIVESIAIIDNEAIRLRDKIKQNKNSEDIKQQRLLYRLKERMMNKLYSQRLLYTASYYKQNVNNCTSNIYINKVNGNDTEIYSLKHYKKKNHKLTNAGSIGYIDYKKLDTKLTLNEAIEKVESYIKSATSKEIRNKKQFSESLKFKKKYHKIKETKLVELSKLKLVKDIHLNGFLNPETTRVKKKQLIEKIDNNKGVYPKDEAILVYKSRDPEDKRRVIYNIEDGYRRYRLSHELNLDKVYVNIIDE